MKNSTFILLLVLSLSGFSQNSKITGVVTYYFNEYQGDKPDIGSKVYVIDSVKHSEFDYKLFEHYSKAKMVRLLLEQTLINKAENDAFIAQYGNKKRHAETVNTLIKFNEGKEKDIGTYKKQLIELNVETDGKFEELDRNNLKMYHVAINKDNIILKTIGANGDYSIDINPGIYYVFIISNNRKGLTISEASGQVYCKKVVIKENEVRDVSHNFKVY